MNIKKYIKKFRHTGRLEVKEKIYRKVDPAHIWHRLLVLAAVLLLLSLAYHGLLFVRVNKGGSVEASSDTGTEKIDERKLTYILNFFEERTLEFTSHNVPDPNITDPSI